MKHFASIIRILFLALFLMLLLNGNVMLWLMLFVISLFAALLFGRIYCGYACPMNTLMLPVEWISKKFKIQTESTPKWLKNGYFSWIALVVSIAVMFLSKRLFHIDLPVLPFWLTVSVIVTLRYRPAVFHNLICPFGALQRTFGRFSRASKSVDHNACIGCKLCEKVCPSDAIKVIDRKNKAVINSMLCHQCTNCQEICPKAAIHYTRIGS